MHQRRKNEDTRIKNFINVKNQYPIISYRRPLYEKCVTNLKKKNTARFNQEIDLTLTKYEKLNTTLNTWCVKGLLSWCLQTGHVIIVTTVVWLQVHFYRMGVGWGRKNMKTCLFIIGQKTCIVITLRIYTLKANCCADIYMVFVKRSKCVQLANSYSKS